MKDVMNNDPYLLYEEDTVLSASRFMKQERIRNLPVVDKEKTLVGLITLREIINMFSANPDKILVKDAMIKLITSVNPDIALQSAIEIMILNKYGCLPIVDENKKLVGMLTEADLLKTLYHVSTLPSELLKAKK